MNDIDQHVNMKIWNRLQETDPNFTRSFNKRGFGGTTINSTYIVMKLTELFGPCGKGWGYDVVKDEVIQGGPIIISGDTRGHWLTHRIMLTLWWKEEGSEGRHVVGPHSGQTDYVGHNKNGIFTDEEAFKKSITDALGKCAALLGIGADIYTGLYDDNKYLAGLKEKYQGIPEEKPKGEVPKGRAAVLAANKEPEPPIAEDPAFALGDFITVVNDYLNAGNPSDKIRLKKLEFIYKEAMGGPHGKLQSVSDLNNDEIKGIAEHILSQEGQ